MPGRFGVDWSEIPSPATSQHQIFTKLVTEDVSWETFRQNYLRFYNDKFRWANQNFGIPLNQADQLEHAIDQAKYNFNAQYAKLLTSQLRKEGLAVDQWGGLISVGIEEVHPGDSLVKTSLMTAFQKNYVENGVPLRVEATEESRNEEDQQGTVLGR